MKSKGVSAERWKTLFDWLRNNEVLNYQESYFIDIVVFDITYSFDVEKYIASKSKNASPQLKSSEQDALRSLQEAVKDATRSAFENEPKDAALLLDAENIKFNDDSVSSIISDRKEASQVIMMVFTPP